MPIELYSDPATFLDLLEPTTAGRLTVLLTAQPGPIAHRIADSEAAVANAPGSDEWLIVIELGDDRLSRLNFDIVERLILDLPSEFLLSSPGRRLTDALGRLAEEALTMTFVGDATGATGAFLMDGLTAGLALVPGTVVVPSVQAVPDLRALLATLSANRTRLLALDERVAARYIHQIDQVEVSGEGSVLLAAFHQPDRNASPVARVQLLQSGSAQSWSL
ncbi:MAG: hypothetical protein HC802_02655 [Caldilineaceae bacterium]|nr:hypothetical protein [Caldilineaceae bacterium]